MILPATPQSIQFYGIGHAMVDLYAVLPPSSLLPSPLKAGKAVHLAENAMDNLVGQVQAMCKDDQSKTALFYKTAGGTTANILRATARLGAACFFSGSTGTDKEGKRDKDAGFFQKECARAGVNARLFSESGHTGRCLAVYSEKSNLKAIAASPSVARSIQVEQVRETEIMNANCIVIEGMIFFNDAACTRVLELCKKHNKSIAIDVASGFAAAKAVISLANAVKNNVIVANQLLIFANEQEYAVIQREAQGNMVYLLQSGAIGIEKRAEKGAKLYWGGDVLEESTTIQSVVDDTGAGDAFAGGFLMHFFTHYAVQAQSHGKSEKNGACINEQLLRDCLTAGNETASTTLAGYGCTAKTE